MYDYSVTLILSLNWRYSVLCFTSIGRLVSKTETMQVTHIDTLLHKKLVKTINHNLNMHFEYSFQMFGGYIII